MTWERIGLPGVGVSHVLTTRDGGRLGVVARADGCRNVSLYDLDEPERVSGAVLLHPDEARIVAELLHHTITVDQVAGPVEPGGIQAVRVRVPAGSGYAGRPLHDLQEQSTATVVAVLRGDRVLPPEGLLDAGDVLLWVGLADAVAGLDELLADSC